MTVIIAFHCLCINTICLLTDSRSGSAEGQTGTVSLWWVWLLVIAAALIVTVIIVYHCLCINTICLLTDSRSGSAEGQTGTVSLWWVWLLVGIAAVIVLAFIVALFIKKKKR